MVNPRRAAVSVLLKIETDNAYSNIVLANYFKETELSSADKALVSALVYGVLDRKITLDHILSKYMKSPIKKTAPFTLNVLRTALYQILYMDKIPQSAAVNEAVKLIKKSKESGNSGFVNAVLRQIIRNENQISFTDTPEDLSVKYSCPLWIVNSFIDDYGIETAKALLKESVKAPPYVIRTNALKISTDNLKRELDKENVSYKESSFKDSLIIEKGIDIKNSKIFKDGLFYVQDLASQTAVTTLEPNDCSRILDMCAAPGGKSFTAACLMGGKGEIIACDLYEQRVKLISDSAKRLGIENIKTACLDACVYDERLGKFDAVICDVVCSGLGVIRRKPEIKYREVPNLNELEEIQYKILCNAVNYIIPGGKILYSTCTLRKAENENIVARFLEEHKQFEKVFEKTLMPHIDNTDGFYFAILRVKV